MARLVDLPVELILVIIDYLQVDMKQASLLYDGPGYDEGCDLDPPLSVSHLHSFLLANSRLSSLLQPLLYRDIFVYRNSQLKQLSRSLQENPSLKEHIMSVTFPWHPYMNGSLDDISPFFRFTNLRTLTTYGFSDSLSLEFDKFSIGTSPVECLRLIACGAQEEPLTTVLSWAGALKTLHYDVEQYGWDVNHEFSPKNLY